MMKQFLDTIRQFDSCGANYQPIVSLDMKQHKSISGGLISLTIYGLSLTFFIYNMIQWVGGANLPKIILSNQYDSQLGPDFQEVTLIIMGDSFSNHVDPFDPQALIFQPIFEDFKNGTISDLDFELRLEPNNFHSVFIKNFSLQNYPIGENTQISDGQLFYIVQCVNGSIPENYKCAPQETIDEFYSYGDQFFSVQIMIQQFNTKKMQVETIKNEVFVYIDTTTTYYSQIILKLQTTIFDIGWVFQDNQQVTYLHDYTFIPQTVASKPLYQVFERDIYVYMYLSLSPNISEEVVQYPKFNEILANTGAVVTAIFYISYLPKLFNKYFFEQKILNQIISLYYPEFSEIKINYNIFDEKLDPKRFQNYYKRLKSVAQEKVTLVNIIYEISMLQFIIQNSKLNQNLTKCRQYGIPLNTKIKLKDNIIELYDQSPKSPNCQEQLETYYDNQMLTDQDFEILCYKNTWLWHL